MKTMKTAICHGDKQGHLLDKNKIKAWDVEEFVGDLNAVETLTCKPKIIMIQDCRGSKPIPLPLVVINFHKPMQLLVFVIQACPLLA